MSRERKGGQGRLENKEVRMKVRLYAKEKGRKVRHGKEVGGRRTAGRTEMENERKGEQKGYINTHIT